MAIGLHGILDDDDEDTIEDEVMSSASGTPLTHDEGDMNSASGTPLTHDVGDMKGASGTPLTHNLDEDDDDHPEPGGLEFSDDEADVKRKVHNLVNDKDERKFVNEESGTE